MARAGSYPIVFEARAKAVRKMRNEIAVSWPAMKQAWDLATDEAPNLGGEDTAPPPLALFIAALAGCAMTNIRMMARQMGVTIDALDVDVRAEWTREVPATGTHHADTKGFDLDIRIDTSAPTDAVVALMHASQIGCFVEHSLGVKARINHRLQHGQGEWIAVDAPLA
jgi:uncharacterized OsmC-like protein